MGTLTSQVQSPQSSQTSGKTGGSTLSPSSGSTNSAGNGKTGSYQDLPNQLNSNSGQKMSTVSSGKGASPMQGSQGAVTYPGQDGQPSMGQPNNYSNTIGSWDNSKSNQSMPVGKGKGA